MVFFVRVVFRGFLKNEMWFCLFCLPFFWFVMELFSHPLQNGILVALISKRKMEKSLVFARTSKNVCWEHSSSCPTPRKKTGQFYFKPCTMELSDPEFSLPKHIHAVWMVGMLNRCGHTGIESREHCIIQGSRGKKANIYNKSIYCKLNPTNSSELERQTLQGYLQGHWVMVLSSSNRLKPRLLTFFPF